MLRALLARVRRAAAAAQDRLWFWMIRARLRRTARAARRQAAPPDNNSGR